MSFPLFLDEHVHIELAELLHRGGYDVLSARDAGRANRGISDDDQLAFATEQGRVLVTYNAKDFYPLSIQWQKFEKPYTGIVLCEQRPAWQLHPRFIRLLDSFPDGFPLGLCMWLP